ncbi:hypothetical protein D3C78_1227090 [compost metagenome]
MERQLGEGFGGGDEVVERAVVPQRHEGVPQLFEAWDVAVADRLLDLAKARTVFQRIGPGVGDFLEQGRKIGELLCVVGLAFQVDDRTAGGRGQRVGEGLGLKTEFVDVVIERSGGHRETHAAQLGDDPFGTFEGLGA